MTKSITTNVTYLNELPQNKINFIAQQELFYKACMHVLRSQGIEVSEKHEQLFDAIPDHDSVDLLDTVEILSELILSHENYEEQKAYNDILSFAKSQVVTVDSLDVLEQSFNFTELELEMGTDFYLDEKIENVIDYCINENSIETLEEFKAQFEVDNWELKLYYATHDKQYVAVFS